MSYRLSAIGYGPAPRCALCCRSEAILQILTELRYSIPDGHTQAISNATLKHRTGLTEGYVSAAVRWLAGETVPYYPQFAHPPRHVSIERRPRADGLPGFETPMLLGSTVDDGVLRCISPSLTTQEQARYGNLLAALLAEPPIGGAP